MDALAELGASVHLAHPLGVWELRELGGTGPNWS